MESSMDHTRNILAQVSLGEDSSRQFKSDVKSEKSLAAEMASFANKNGGTIFIGVADDGYILGLTLEDVNRINQLISNAASQGVRSPLLVETQNISLENGRIVIVLTVPKGIDKPYFDKDGVIWLKTGSDKRRVNSKEELQRIFQTAAHFHADEQPTKAGIDKLDKLRFRDFLRDMYKKDYPENESEQLQLLQNMNLATNNGTLNLAGVLMFAEQPEWIVPQFVVKAIRYPGNEIHETDYVDTEDFSGPLPKVFDGVISFIMRNLHKVQAGKGVNAPGTLEIPEAVFEELLVNALVHRDYLVSAPIRVFLYNNRIEIISPGHLPNNLTVEKIQTGNTNIRNPILASYVAKGLLPYHGLGSGIKRALSNWEHISFFNDHENCLFKTIIHRTIRYNTVENIKFVQENNKLSVKSIKTVGKEYTQAKNDRKNTKKLSGNPSKSIKTVGKEHTQAKNDRKNTKNMSGKNTHKQKTTGKILKLCREKTAITIPELAAQIGITERSIERSIKTLKKRGLLRRIDGRKQGYWEVIE